MVLDLKILRIRKIALHYSLDIYNFMRHVIKAERKILDMKREHFFVISLQASNYVIKLELIGLGSISNVCIRPREVFQLPAEEKAAGVILVHNHPSGLVIPSELDIKTTNRIFHAGKLIDIPVIDHVIIADHSYYSFKDSGLLKNIEDSIINLDRFAIEKECEKVFQEELKKIKQDHQEEVKASLKEGLQKGKMEGVEMGKIEIALIMLQDKEPIEKIIKWTGLSRLKIEKLLSI